MTGVYSTFTGRECQSLPRIRSTLKVEAAARAQGNVNLFSLSGLVSPGAPRIAGNVRRLFVGILRFPIGRGEITGTSENFSFQKFPNVIPYRRRIL
jgi:hypothetical protein